MVKNNFKNCVPLAIAPVFADAAAMTEEGALIISSLFVVFAACFPPFLFFDFHAW